MEFTKNWCFVKDEKSMEVVLFAWRRKNMYVVDYKIAKSTVYLLVRSKEDLSWKWHNKLNHLNFKEINKLVRRQLVEWLPNIVYNKDKWKQIKSYFKSKLMESSTRPLSLLHTVIFGLVDLVSLSLWNDLHVEKEWNRAKISRTYATNSDWTRFNNYQD